MKSSVATLSLTICLALTLVMSLRGQSAPVTISPAGPTLMVGQTQQLSANGAVVPTGLGVGAWFTCVLYSDQSVRCAGLNNQGEIGDGTTVNALEPHLVSGTVSPATLGNGNEHACTLVTDGRMQCWGTNYTGQLGVGSIGGFSPSALFVQGMSNATKAVTGGYFTCALLSDRTAQCWGRNQDGQLGNGDSTTDTSVPGPVQNLGPVADLFAGGYHTCALIGDGTAKCWGRNGSGQVGDGTAISPVTVPHQVVGLTTAVSLSLGGYHSCVLLQDRTVQCWGMSDFGQIGVPGAVSARQPQTVNGISNATAIFTGYRHSCAVVADGTVHCWGHNNFGQLGDRTTVDSASPVLAQGIVNPLWLSGGEGHSCALMPDRSVLCWGENDYGELGIGSTTNSLVPVRMHTTGLTWASSNSNVASVSATGLVTAVARGTATITATDGFGNAGSTTVTVREMLNLSVATAGDGGGSVVSSPAGIGCPGACAASFISDSQVTLTATAGANSTFGGWIGCDATSGATCTVAMSAARSVSARFDLRRYALTVSVTRTLLGNGTVTSNPTGISCGTDCSESYVVGTAVTLTATPAFGSLFNGWSGCDSTNGAACTVAIDRARSISANFIGISMHE